MRPRLALLSSLAPLIGLSAVMAIISAEPASPRQSREQQHPLARLIHSVFQFVAPAAERPSSRSHAQGPSPRLLFASAPALLSALSSSISLAPSLRRIRLHLLRC
jgi:hypothetical protein